MTAATIHTYIVYTSGGGRASGFISSHHVLAGFLSVWLGMWPFLFSFFFCCVAQAPFPSNVCQYPIVVVS